MSGGNDNIFARWARRKQAVRDSETPVPDQEEYALNGAAEAGDKPAEQRIATAEPEVAEPAEPLPRVEDLTADSDLSVFLREGVPEALKSAALRKIWSLDPVIRDYIGPSEYAWDFNQPDSMAGFGPLDAKKAAAEFLATMSGDAHAGSAKAATSPKASPASSEATSASPEQNADTGPDNPADTASADETVELSHGPASPQPPSSDCTAAAAGPEEAIKPAGLSRIAVRPRHGSAMPR